MQSGDTLAPMPALTRTNRSLSLLTCVLGHLIPHNSQSVPRLSYC